MIRELVCRCRSVRRFKEDEPVDMDTLRELVDLARMSASAANLQPLKYVLSCEKSTNNLIFDTLGWAGYLDDWDGPGPGQRPCAYIVIVGDTDISKNFGCDLGIASQSIALGAAEKGLGCCMVGNIDRGELGEALGLDSRYEILLVLAIGVPDEKISLEEIAGGNVRYWRDESGVHHVPKRSLEEVILPWK